MDKVIFFWIGLATITAKNGNADLSRAKGAIVNIIVIFLMLCSCNETYPCEKGEPFKEFFESALTSMDNFVLFEEKTSRYIIGHNNAHCFLEMITQISRTKYQRGNFINDKDSYMQTRQEWKSWYELNKCSISLENIDTMYFHFLENINEPTTNIFFEFPNEWKLLFTSKEWGIPDLDGEPEQLTEEDLKLY